MLSLEHITNEYGLVDINYIEGGYIHEIEQINLFLSTLQSISSPSPAMMELGSFESFYSILFNKFFEKKNIQSKNICVEIDTVNYETGLKNAQKNKCNDFYCEHAAIGVTNLAQYRDDQPNQFHNKSIAQKSILLKDLFTKYNIDKLDLLHVDVQGSEASVLEEAIKDRLPINNFFINIHDCSTTCNYYGYSVYKKCKELLDSLNVTYAYDSSTTGGYGDGLIVAKTNIS